MPAVLLDDFYRESVRTVIKVDVEGAEYRVLKSGRQFLDSKETVFFVELHGWGDRSIHKYPIHVCWLFLANHYAVRKIGTIIYCFLLDASNAQPRFWLSFPILVSNI